MGVHLLVIVPTDQNLNPALPTAEEYWTEISLPSSTSVRNAVHETFPARFGSG